jgi:hypothetical protein
MGLALSLPSRLQGVGRGKSYCLDREPSPDVVNRHVIVLGERRKGGLDLETVTHTGHPLGIGGFAGPDRGWELGRTCDWRLCWLGSSSESGIGCEGLHAVVPGSGGHHTYVSHQLGVPSLLCMVAKVPS